MLLIRGTVFPSMKMKPLALAALGPALFAAAAQAHHSAAMFDTATELTLEGTITQYDWKRSRPERARFYCRSDSRPTRCIPVIECRSS